MAYIYTHSYTDIMTQLEYIRTLIHRACALQYKHYITHVEGSLPLYFTSTKASVSVEELGILKSR